MGQLEKSEERAWKVSRVCLENQLITILLGTNLFPVYSIQRVGLRSSRTTIRIYIGFYEWLRCEWAVNVHPCISWVKIYLKWDACLAEAQIPLSVPFLFRVNLTAKLAWLAEATIRLMQRRYPMTIKEIQIILLGNYSRMRCELEASLQRCCARGSPWPGSPCPAPWRQAPATLHMLKAQKQGAPPCQSSGSLVGLVWRNPSAEAAGTLLVLDFLSCAPLVNFLARPGRSLLGKVCPHLDEGGGHEAVLRVEWVVHRPERVPEEVQLIADCWSWLKHKYKDYPQRNKNQNHPGFW